MGLNIAEELRDVFGELSINKLQTCSISSNFELDIGQGEFGHFFVWAYGFDSSFAAYAIINVPDFSSFANGRHGNIMVTKFIADCQDGVK